MNEPTTWKLVALYEARRAHRENLQSRRGTVPFGEDAVAVYDNSPFADAPTLRDRVLEELARRLGEHGMARLAEASYPPSGEEDGGYTRVLIFRGRDEALVTRLWTDLLRTVLHERPRGLEIGFA